MPFLVRNVTRPQWQFDIRPTNANANLPPFQGARPDHMLVESSSCFSRDLVSFVLPCELGPVHTYPDIFESATFSFRI